MNGDSLNSFLLFTGPVGPNLFFPGADGDDDEDEDDGVAADVDEPFLTADIASRFFIKDMVVVVYVARSGRN